MPTREIFDVVALPQVVLAAIFSGSCALAAEAIAAYVARETEIIDGIHRGLADVQAGRLVPHEEAMAELGAAIEAAARGDG